MKLAEQFDQAEEQLRTDGVAILKGVFTQQETHQMRAAAYHTMHQVPADQAYADGGRIQYRPDLEEPGLPEDQVHFPALMFMPTMINPHLNRVRTDERMQEITRRLVGPDIRLLNNQIYFKLPGAPDSFAWHQDLRFRLDQELFPNVQRSYIQTVIAVDRWREDNSPVSFVRGSHERGFSQALLDMSRDKAALRDFNASALPEEFQGLEIITPQLEPGDMAIWGLLTVHGSGPNNSEHARMTIMHGFAHKDHSVEWPVHMEDGQVVEQLDRTQLPQRLQRQPALG